MVRVRRKGPRTEEKGASRRGPETDERRVSEPIAIQVAAHRHRIPISLSVPWEGERGGRARREYRSAPVDESHVVETWTCAGNQIGIAILIQIASPANAQNATSDVERNVGCRNRGSSLVNNDLLRAAQDRARCEVRVAIAVEIPRGPGFKT